MSRGTRGLLVIGQGTVPIPAVICDRCGGWARVQDPTDLPRSWAARVVGSAVRHYCQDCDPVRSVGKGTVHRHG